jgi:hypothetical protein
VRSQTALKIEKVPRVSSLPSGGSLNHAAEAALAQAARTTGGPKAITGYREAWATPRRRDVYAGHAVDDDYRAR